MRRGRWLKVIGVVAGAACLLALLPCSLPTVRGSEGWVRTSYTLRYAGEALRLYHDTHGRLPPAVVCDKEGRPLYSWRVLVLPYLERRLLYEQFHLDEPWDSPHNLALAKSTPSCFQPMGSFHWAEEEGTTRIQAITGPGTAFERPGLTWADFPDGPANTALVVEAGEPVPWSKPGDVVYDPVGPLPAFGSGYTKPEKFLCYEVGRHPGFAVGFADGTARFVRTGNDEHRLRAMFTRNGGEPFNARELR